MMKNIENEKTITRDGILKLMENKDKIEAQLRDLNKILDDNKVGMREPLVDRDGYPRHDIDVYQVRQARHKIIYLQNDHKSLMNQIEKGLHYLHSQSSCYAGSNANSESPCRVEVGTFAKVVQVDKDSPADLANLQVGDLVVSFGSINSVNFQSMQDIASVVQHSVGRNVTVVVKRGRLTVSVTLIPKEWKGKGLLGCVIVGLDNVER